MSKQAIYVFGPFSLNQAEQKLLRDNEVVSLTPKAFETLTFLIKNKGHLVKKDELLDEVWKDTMVEESNLNVVIHMLRKALGDAPRQSKYVETIAKRGYRFVAEVTYTEIQMKQGEENIDRPHEPTLASPFGQTNLDTSLVPLSSNLTANSQTQNKPQRGVSLVVLAMAILLSSVFFYLWYSEHKANVAHSTPPTNIKSIAVLPFRVLSGEKEDEYLSVGMADALITSLSQTRQVVVRQTESIAKYQNSGRDSLEVGREQGVDAVLDGQVQRIGSRIRVTVRLIRTNDGVAIWADRFDKQFTNIFAIQDEIAENVALITITRIGGNRPDGSDRLTTRYTENNEAYQAYLKGRYLWNKRTADSLQKALLNFQQAIKLDPNFSIAYIGLADTYTLMSFFTLASPKESFPKAKEAAEKALAIDNRLAEAYTALGQYKAYYEWDWLGAEEQFQKGISLNPNSPLLHHWRSLNLLAMGRMGEARAAMQRSLELDPLLLITNVNLGRIDYYQKNYDQAIKQYEKALELDQHFTRTHFRLGLAYMQKGDFQNAQLEYQQVTKLAGDTPQIKSYLAYLSAVSGKKAEALKELENLQERGKDEYVSPYNIALIYVGLGENDKAFEWLEKAFLDHSTEMIYFKVDPILEPLHTDHRYQNILQRMRLKN